MSSSKPRILIVEDEPGIADTLQYALRTEGFEPAWVATGEAALAQVQAQLPALVILDVGLPDSSGFEVFKRLRAISADVPVIFLTARSDEIDRVVGLELGADDYVPKPFSPRELVARLRAILRRVQPAADAGPLQAGALTLWPEKRLAEWRGKALNLTSIEFNILEVLMRNAGRVVGKNEISEQALGRPLARFDRSIDVHLSAIRQKLGDGASAIRTVRGMGYHLVKD